MMVFYETFETNERFTFSNQLSPNWFSRNHEILFVLWHLHLLLPSVALQESQQQDTK